MKKLIGKIVTKMDLWAPIWHARHVGLIKNLEKLSKKESCGYDDITMLCGIIGSRELVSYSREARESAAKRLYSAISNFTVVKDKFFLDVGTGYGTTVLEFEKRGAGLSVGIDLVILPVIFKEAAEEHLTCNIIKADIANAPFPDESFDIVHTNSIEHFTEPYRSFEEMIRITKKVGLLFLFMRNPYYSPDASHLYNHVNIPWSHLLFNHDLLFKFVREHSFEHYGGSPEEYADSTIKQFQELNKLDIDDYKSMIFEASNVKVLHYKEIGAPSPLYEYFYEIFKDKLKNYSKRSLFACGIDAVLKRI